MDSPMDGLYPVEVLLSFSEKRMLRYNRSEKGGEKESEKNGFRNLPPCFDQLIHQIEERKKEFPTLFLGRTAMTQSPFETRKKGKKQAGLEHELQRRFRRTLLEFAQELISKARGRTLLYFSAVPEDSLVGLVFNGKPGSGGMADDPDHSHRVLLESFIGVTDHSDDPLFEVGHPADIVYDGEICDIIEKAVHRDIPPQGILRRRSKAIGPNNLPFFCLDFPKFRSTPESGHFDDLSSLEENMNQSESAADDPAVFEEGVDLMGVGIGGHIEIFRGFSEEKIPDTSTDEIS